MPYRAFKARDKHFILAVGNDAIWQRFCDALNLGGLYADPRYQTNDLRVKHRDELEKTLSEIFVQEEAAHWVEILKENKVPCGIINSVGEVVNHPQALYRDMVVETLHSKAGKINVLGNPIKFSSVPVQYKLPPPALGEHNLKVLVGLGYSKEEIEALQAEGVI